MSPSEQVRGARDEIRHPCESANRWRSLFLRMQKKGALPDSRERPLSPDHRNHLFGRPLFSICDEDKRLPKPIREVLSELWRRAPATEGVFRKAGNAKRLSEVKVQLDAGEDLDVEVLPVVLLAALLKDFLRQLPDGLLGALLYPAWMSAMETEEAQRCSELRRVSDRLPKANVHLLQRLLLVLRHISQSADSNKMDARNLAVCVSPNLLPLEHLSLDTVEKVTALTQFLIDNCGEIFKDSLQTADDQLADSTDSLWDSAYESADPEADADPAGDVAAGEERARPPHRPSGAAARRPGRPLGRRRSEPAMLRSAGMRTLLKLSRAGDEEGDARAGDEDGEARPLKKQNSHDSFLLHNRGPTAASSTPAPSGHSSPCSSGHSSPCPSGHSSPSPCDAPDRALALSGSAPAPDSRPRGHTAATPGGGVKRHSWSTRREDMGTAPSHRGLSLCL
ncbi:T-cell activation Rho GTPase-activating protein-like [Conger conger]|uniref:T-cell activation Rho GTPase-activating protein-like n=1 Tax=Conger conger TaxID=82655 RepID=UPI002A5A6CE8|nr:T-cell activation Rho GTPase-activating protein-like [Conger conger]